MEKYIDLAVKYLPLLLVLIGVIIGGVKGLMRGAHKSVVLLIHSLVTFTICLIIFFICVNFEATDKFLLKLVNSIIGFFDAEKFEDNKAVQLFFDVSEEHETFRECMLEFIPKNMNFMDGLELVLKENGAYINTLVDLVYKIAFGVVCWVLHLVLTILSHIIYWLCWPEKRYKKEI